MTVVTAINPDWELLREEITSQTLAACKKLQMAIDSASELPPLELGEALEDAANRLLNLVDEVSSRHCKLHRASPSG